MKTLLLATALLLCPCIYLGVVDAQVIHNLQHCDIIVLSCDANPDIVKTLHEKGKVVLCYVSVSKLRGDEPWFEPLPGNAIINYDLLTGSMVVNPCNPYVQKLLDKAFTYALSKSFDGVAFADITPSNIKCIENLLATLRVKHPKARVMVIGGVDVLRELAPYADYLVYNRFVVNEEVKTGPSISRERLSRDLRVLRNLETLYNAQIILVAELPALSKVHVKIVKSLWRDLAPHWPLYMTVEGFKELGLCPGTPSQYTTRTLAEGSKVRVGIDESILLAYTLLALTIVAVSILVVKSLKRR